MSNPPRPVVQSPARQLVASSFGNIDQAMATEKPAPMV